MINSKISIKINDNLFECLKCKKQFSKYGIGSHYFRSHTKKGKAHDSNIGFKLGTRKAWNRDLTSKTDDRIKIVSEKLKEGYKSGRLVPYLKGKKLSKKTRKNISIGRKLYLKNNNVSGWNILRNKKSYPEKVFIEIINSLNIKSHDIISEYFEEGYFIDFAFINDSDKVAVEIDGSQHFKIKDRTKSDKRKDKILKSKNWRVFRIVANDLIKKNFDIEEFKDFLLKNNKDNLKSYKKKFTNFIKHKELKNLEKEKLKNKKEENKLKIIEERKNLILNSNVDFNKNGWKIKLSKLLNLSHSVTSKFIRKHMNEFYLEVIKKQDP